MRYTHSLHPQLYLRVQLRDIIILEPYAELTEQAQFRHLYSTGSFSTWVPGIPTSPTQILTGLQIGISDIDFTWEKVIFRVAYGAKTFFWCDQGSDGRCIV